MRFLFLDCDTTRPDHLGCYGYHRNTSPNIDRIAADGIRFNNYYSSDAPCLPARAALMSGRFGIHTGVIGHGGTAADMRLEGRNRKFRSGYDFEFLPYLFRRCGYKTATVSPFAERHSAYWFYTGFKEMFNPGRCGNESAELITPFALDWIKKNAQDDNWFLHVNYWDPHGPYRAPESFGNPFKDDPLPEWLTEETLAKHIKAVGPHTAQENNMYDDNENRKLYPRYLGHITTMERLREAIDGYDCGIAYMDSHIGTLFEALEAKGVMDDLVVIISADHGENMGELGIYCEHATADYITCRIPMIIRYPSGGMKGHVDNGLHHNLDLAPTISELLACEHTQDPRWDGSSFAPAILEGKECGKEYAVISQGAHVCQRSVRFGPWLYMKTYHDGYHLFPEEMLFNIEDDPHEQNDLAETNPDVRKQGAKFLQEWHDDMMKSMPEGYDIDPMQTVLEEGGPSHTRGHLAKYCSRLEKTGRGDAVPLLKARHPKEF